MIVRILGEGQFLMASEDLAAISQIDDRLQAAAEAGDEAAFSAALGELVATIRKRGSPISVDTLEASDAIVPDAQTTLAEARELLSAEGLVPGSGS